MILLPLYATIVWAVCYRMRRTWLGWAVLVGAEALVAGLALADIRARFWLGAGEGARWSSLQFVLWAEAVMVLLVGAFVLLLPRERVELPCRRCRYELESLASEHPQANPTCPECGLEHAARKVHREALDARAA